MWWFLILILSLLGFGLVIDWIAKKKGLTKFDPEENEKNVPDAQRIYTENYLQQIRNQDDQGFH
ncbi:hypothetical protein [Cytobacillus kochii]|uniref:hypothetical protein n=1 Tax=Cytobacillus kochii TaxID=859143 RepID=UPI00204142C3|nr:hypothetical protein [Cytobacillus kochii]MCM3321974.1 hypothetical protein [Cytobacillus kochii]MCM3343194.1 hypothetical protein [Cytobacillus kochii]